MRSDDYGPVALSRLKAEQAHIYQALEDGRRVLIAHKGEVVAAMDPAPALPRQILAMYSMPQIDTARYELSATVMNQGVPGPNEWLKRARSGNPALVTRKGKLFGAFRALDATELAAEPSPASNTSQQDAAVDKFLDQHPDASADELADFTASLETGSKSTDEHIPYLEDLFGARARNARQRKAAVEAAYRAGFAADSDLVDDDLRAIVNQAAAG